jgi:hypothetical protein
MVPAPIDQTLPTSHFDFSDLSSSASTITTLSSHNIAISPL